MLRVDWTHPPKWSAEGFVHPTDGSEPALEAANRLIIERSAALRRLIRSSHPELWQSLEEENEADIALWNMLNDEAHGLPRCP